MCLKRLDNFTSTQAAGIPPARKCSPPLHCFYRFCSLAFRFAAGQAPQFQLLRDLTQFFLLATATFFFAMKGVSTGATQRAFWLLIALGFCVWSVNMFLWVYYELWLNRPVPSLPIGEFLLFIKLVPMLAALALQPHKERSDRTRLLGLFDLTSLLVCWTYVYLFWAMAYLLAGNDLARYNRNSDIVDAVGNQVFLLILAVVAIRSRGRWRGFYLHFLGASAMYSFASILINRAIDSGRYYTGSFYDVPLTAALAWFCVTAITYNVDSPSGEPQSSEEPKIENRPSSKMHSVVRAARHAGDTLDSGDRIVAGDERRNSGSGSPLSHSPDPFYDAASHAFCFCLSKIFSTFKLAGYLRDASDAYSNLRRFEDQLVQNEKLASLGKLVARVAHEINSSHERQWARNVEVLNSLPCGRPQPSKDDNQNRRVRTTYE